MISTILLLAALSQTPATRPAYEVAEIKVNTSGSDHSESHGTKGQVTMSNMSLKRLIERAYEMSPHQVTGPDWLDQVHLNVVAKYPPDTTPADRTRMLRTLLEDQLKLGVHHESKEMNGYALMVAKKGFKLQPAEAGSSSTSSNGNGRVRDYTAKKTSMAQLADFLTRAMGQGVVDKTGIAGIYDFEIKFTSDDLAAETKNTDVDLPPSVFTVLQDQLGLRLQAQKVPVDTLVVDHVERAPIEN